MTQDDEVSLSVVNHGAKTYYLFEGRSPREAIVAEPDAFEKVKA